MTGPEKADCIIKLLRGYIKSAAHRLKFSRFLTALSEGAQDELSDQLVGILTDNHLEMFITGKFPKVCFNHFNRSLNFNVVFKK